MLNPARATPPPEPVELDPIKSTCMSAETQSQTSPPERPLALRVPVVVATVSADAAADSRYVMDALQRQLQLPTSDSPNGNPWEVTPLTVEDLDRAAQLPFVLVIVEARLDALREAYSQLKSLSHQRLLKCGVLTLGARDTSAGSRYYRRLAMGAMRFLDLPLLNLGPCPLRGPDFGTRLARLAQRIQDAAQLHLRSVSPVDTAS